MSCVNRWIEQKGVGCMRYEMGLYNKPFQSIQSGKKYMKYVYMIKTSTNKQRRWNCIYESYDKRNDGGKSNGNKAIRKL